MKSIAIRQRLTADANHTIHVTLPPEMGDEVEIIILPTGAKAYTMPQESLDMARLMDETGFARAVLASAEEDCWNAL
jgi:hypothetical protein